MKRILLAVIFIIIPLRAQESVQLFTNSINPDTGAISFVWVDLADGKQTPIASFAAGGDCPPQRLGDTFFYEPQNLTGENFVYQIDLTNGNILPLEAAQEQGLHCPIINPDGSQIAWLQYGEEAHSLVFTSVSGASPVVVATHPTIYDVQWSPDGELVVYTAIGADETFRPLYSYQTEATEFWPRDAGLVVDYLWTPDSSTLLVAYYTQDNAVIGSLSKACVLDGGCSPTPIATFPPEVGLLLQNAFSADNTKFLVIEETNDGMGDFSSELYVVDLTTGETTQLVEMPGLLKTSAAWVGNTIYFIGAVFDETTFTMSDSAIYEVSEQGGTPNIAYSADDYLPAQIFWTR